MNLRLRNSLVAKNSQPISSRVVVIVIVVIVWSVVYILFGLFIYLLAYKYEVMSRKLKRQPNFTSDEVKSSYHLWKRTARRVECHEAQIQQVVEHTGLLPA